MGQPQTELGLFMKMAMRALVDGEPDFVLAIFSPPVRNSGMWEDPLHIERSVHTFQ